MKFLPVSVLVVLLSCFIEAKDPALTKQTIQVKTDLSNRRGKIYLKVYPYEQGKGSCRKREYNLSHKASKEITVSSGCCWRELRVAEIKGRDGKKMVLGRVTAEEPSCQHEKLLLTVHEGKQEKGKKFRPVDIEIGVVEKGKKKSKK